MALADDYRNQANSAMDEYFRMSQSTPNFKQDLTKMYETPVLRPLVNERAGLEAQYLPTIFNTFTENGTEASDLSPAAKLAMMGGNVGRLQSRIGANQDIQNFYGMQINDLARTLADQYNSKRDDYWKRYTALDQQSNNAFDRDMQRQEMSLRQAAAGREARAYQDQVNQQKLLQDAYLRQKAMQEGAAITAAAKEKQKMADALAAYKNGLQPRGFDGSDPTTQLIHGLRAGQRQASSLAAGGDPLAGYRTLKRFIEGSIDPKYYD